MKDFQNMYELEPSDVWIATQYDLDYDERNNEIVAYLEVWFDADKKFDIHVQEEPETWVHFYVMWNPINDKTHACYEIDRPDKSDFCEYVPTENEEDLFRFMISEAIEKFFLQSPVEYVREAIA